MNASPSIPSYLSHFESLAYGLFVHWGLYSQLGKGEWVKKWHEIPMEEYRPLMDSFTAEDFNGRELAAFARRCGMNYVVLTTRHHDGFSLYDTRGLNEYDAPHSPAGRDLIAEFVAGCRAEGVVPFFYHTTLDWSWDTEHCSDEAFASYIDYLVDSVEILCTQYGEIGGLWFDGNWSRPQADWQEERLYTMIRSHQPEAIIVNNSSINALGALGHPLVDVVTYEQGRPEQKKQDATERYRVGEMCQTMNLHWGIGKHDFLYKSPAEVIADLAACRRVGANYLLNIGPTAQGGLPDYERACLERVGDWATLYQHVLREGRPCGIEAEGDDFVLADSDGTRFYYVAHNLPIHKNGHKTAEMGATEGFRPMRGQLPPLQTARWLDVDEDLELRSNNEGMELDCTGYPYGSNLVVRIAELSC